MAALAKTEKSLRDLLDLNEAVTTMFNYYDNQVKANNIEFTNISEAAEEKRAYYLKAKQRVFNKLEQETKTIYEEIMA